MEIAINYYVRRRFEEKEYQKGAFGVFENAKKCCDKYPGYNIYDLTGNLIYRGKEATVSTIISDAISWAKATANNNAHGYDNTKAGRGGTPDYACSSFVNEAYRQAGVDLPVSKDVYTAKMKSIYLEAGFIDVTKKVNFKSKKGLLAGDVLLTPGQHVELYVGGGKVAGARGNANSGHAENGKPGDQTGSEIAVSAYWNFPWKIALRYVGKKGSEESTTTTGTASTYIVQAGAFQVEANADKRIADLKAKNLHSIKKQVGSYWVVQLGVFKVRENAETLTQLAHSKGFDVIIKEVS